jgi:hypothetical protein
METYIPASLPTRSPSHPRKPARKAGFSTFESGFGRETDCLLEGDGFEPSVPNRSAPVFETVSHDGLTASRPGDASGEQYYNANYDKCKVALEHGAHRRPIALQQYCQQQVTPGPRDDTAGTPGKCPIECNALR